MPELDYSYYLYKSRSTIFDYLKNQNIKDLEKARKSFKNYGLTVPEDNLLQEAIDRIISLESPPEKEVVLDDLPQQTYSELDLVDGEVPVLEKKKTKR